MDYYVLCPFFIYKYDRIKCKKDDDNQEFMAQFGNVLGSLVGEMDNSPDRLEEDMQQSQRAEDNEHMKRIRRLSTAIGRLKTDVQKS